MVTIFHKFVWCFSMILKSPSALNKTILAGVSYGDGRTRSDIYQLNIDRLTEKQYLIKTTRF